MKDIYLQSTDKDALLADLATVYPKFFYKDERNEDALAQAGDGFAIDYIGTMAKPGTGRWDEEGNELAPVEFYPGVYCNIRLFNGLEGLFYGFTSEKTCIQSPSTPCRVFA